MLGSQNAFSFLDLLGLGENEEHKELLTQLKDKKPEKVREALKRFNEILIMADDLTISNRTLDEMIPSLISILNQSPSLDITSRGFV